VIAKELPDGKKWRYEWSRAGHLKSVETPDGKKVSFAYDALGRRVSKKVGDTTTRWMWSGNVPIHEWREREGDGQDDVATTWVFEPDTFVPVAKITSDGKRHSIISDYLGTPKEMRDEAGELAWKAQLDIYGVATVEEGEKTDCPWRWQGQYEDVETGLYYNRFRYYDPARGDYISQDPIRLLGGLRMYGYVEDPLTWSDPFGLSIVIGENQMRVDNAARTLGAETIASQNVFALKGADYTGVAKLSAAQEAKSLAVNREWIQEQIKKGETIYDIGRDPARVAKGTPISKWYAAELDEIAQAKARGEDVKHVPKSGCT